MNYQKNIVHTDKLQSVAESIAAKISDRLKEGRNVVWFVSGGSNIPLAVAVRELLNIPPGVLLHVCLVDERYGKIGHHNSNWQALADAGFNFTGCKLHPILLDKLDADQTAHQYSESINMILDNSSYAIGVFGLGEDGHTAGLLPFNPLMNSTNIFGAYRAKDYSRISATPLLITLLDEVVLFVWDKGKQHALEEVLLEGSIDQVPGRILKDAKKFTVYTNIIEGEE